MDLLRESPVLRSSAKTGKAKFWQLRLVTDRLDYFLERTWWQEGSVKQSSTPERILGKNSGRANSTTDGEQAEREFDRAVQKRRDKGFSENGSASHVYTKPMLAHGFADRKDGLKWPVYIQPKLDGFRMLMDGEAAWTRGGKDHVRECVQHLMWDTGDLVVDGELLLPGNRPLQITASAAKKFRAESKTLEYHVYDIVEPLLPFSERTELLKALVEKGVPPNVKLVPTLLLGDEESVMLCHGVFKSHGYEGSIVRSATGLYEVGFRSHGLLKLKDFVDAEFTVVDVEHGKGSFEDKAILVFATANGLTFNAVPEGNDEYRRGLWTNRKKLIGQMWTVRYQTLSREGKPIFPVAVAPRAKEDR